MPKIQPYPQHLETGKFQRLIKGIAQRGTVFFIAFAFIFYYPLFQISQFLPFAYWDAFTDQYAQLNGLSTKWESLPGNIFYSFFLDRIQFRPISVTIFNLQYLVFKGEFWAWYLLKWSMFIACCFILYKLIKKSTDNQLASIFGLTFFLFHPMPFVTDVMAQDGYVVFFGGLLLFALKKWSERNSTEMFSLEHLDSKQFFVFILLYMATAFSKEIGIAFAFALFTLFLFTFKRKWTPSFYSRLILPFLICLFMSYRLLQVNHPSSHLHDLFVKLMSIFKTNTAEHISDNHLFLYTLNSFRPEMRSLMIFFRYFFPDSPHNILAVALVFIMFLGISLAFLKKEKELFTSFSFTFVGFLGSLIILSAVYPCPKYLPVPVFFFAYALGLSSFLFLKHFKKSATTLIVLLTVFIPLLTSGDIYSQWLGMMQSLYEETDIIQFMEQKKEEGFALTWTGFRNKDELPWEKGASIQEFFLKSSSKFYGYRHSMKFTVISASGVPKSGKFVMLSSLSPKEIASGTLNSIGIDSLQGVTGIYRFKREHYGFFEILTGKLSQLGLAIGNSYPQTIDCASPHPSNISPNMPNPAMFNTSYFSLTSGPHLLYVFDKIKNKSPSANLIITKLTPLRRYGAFGR